MGLICRYVLSVVLAIPVVAQAGNEVVFVGSSHPNPSAGQ